MHRTEETWFESRQGNVGAGPGVQQAPTALHLDVKRPGLAARHSLESLLTMQRNSFTYRYLNKVLIFVKTSARILTFAIRAFSLLQSLLAERINQQNRGFVKNCRTPVFRQVSHFSVGIKPGLAGIKYSLFMCFFFTDLPRPISLKAPLA